MNIRPIHNEEDYRAALKNVSALLTTSQNRVPLKVITSTS